MNDLLGTPLPPDEPELALQHPRDHDLFMAQAEAVAEDLAIIFARVSGQTGWDARKAWTLIHYAVNREVERQEKEG